MHLQTVDFPWLCQITGGWWCNAILLQHINWPVSRLYKWSLPMWKHRKLPQPHPLFFSVWLDETKTKVDVAVVDFARELLMYLVPRFLFGFKCFFCMIFPIVSSILIGGRNAHGLARWTKQALDRASVLLRRRCFTSACRNCGSLGDD